MLKVIAQGKIRNTLLLGLVILIIVPTFSAVGVYFHSTKTSIEQQTYNSLVAALDKQVYFINHWFWQQRQYSLLLSSSGKVSSMDPKIIEDYLINIAYTNPVVEDLGVADKNGNVIAGTTPSDGISISDREYFKQSIKGKTWISDVITNRFSGNPVIVFSAPAYYDHQLVGVLFSAVSLDSISRLMQNFNLDQWTESYLVNADGALVTESKYKSQLVNQGLIEESSLGYKVSSFGIKQALAGNSGADKYINYLGREVYGVYRPISTNRMAIIIEKDADAVLKKEIRQAYYSIFNTGVLITFIFLPVVVWLSRRFAKPLEKLATAAKQIGNGHYGYVVDIQSNQEINELVAAFNKMSIQIKAMHHQLNEQIKQLKTQQQEIQCQNEELAASQDELIAVNEKLEQVACTDPLTHLYNRRYLFKKMKQYIESACKDNIPVSVILFDIDYFKRVNDTYGHQVGDQVLVQLTSLVAKSIKAEHLLARFGGEEFVILLPNEKLAESAKFAEYLRKLVEEHIFKTDGGDIKITISLGVTCFTGEYCSIYGKELDRLLSVADNLLYEAKRSGRNKVVSS
ncbi:diguanylate cyclase [Peptococcaceae bacterium 1198_IL3148]